MQQADSHRADINSSVGSTPSGSAPVAPAERLVGDEDDEHGRDEVRAASAIERNRKENEQGDHGRWPRPMLRRPKIPRSVADQHVREQIEREPAAETGTVSSGSPKFASVFFIASAKRTTPATIGRWR